jgi:hypothetical protein
VLCCGAVVATLVPGAAAGPAPLPQLSGRVDLLRQANVKIDGARARDLSFVVAAAGDVNVTDAPMSSSGRGAPTTTAARTRARPTSSSGGRRRAGSISPGSAEAASGSTVLQRATSRASRSQARAT